VANAVDEQPLRDPELGRRQAHAERVLHDRGHARHLAAQPLVEAVDVGGAALQDRVAVATDERHRRRAARLHLRVERRGLLELAGLRLDLGGRLRVIGSLVAHRRASLGVGRSGRE
jgi:hypothetical protein